MNQRIRELMDQAGGEFYNGFLGSPNSIKFTEEEFEKFAELIVRECVSVGRTAFLNDHSTVPVFPAENIKQHFGVE